MNSTLVFVNDVDPKHRMRVFTDPYIFIDEGENDDGYDMWVLICECPDELYQLAEFSILKEAQEALLWLASCMTFDDLPVRKSVLLGRKERTHYEQES